MCPRKSKSFAGPSLKGVKSSFDLCGMGTFGTMDLEENRREEKRREEKRREEKRRKEKR